MTRVSGEFSPVIRRKRSRHLGEDLGIVSDDRAGGRMSLQQVDHELLARPELSGVSPARDFGKPRRLSDREPLIINGCRARRTAAFAMAVSASSDVPS